MVSPLGPPIFLGPVKNLRVRPPVNGPDKTKRGKGEPKRFGEAKTRVYTCTQHLLHLVGQGLVLYKNPPPTLDVVDRVALIKF